eukprot:3938540-Rhodomonas_salina.1
MVCRNPVVRVQYTPVPGTELSTKSIAALPVAAAAPTAAARAVAEEGVPCPSPPSMGAVSSVSPVPSPAPAQEHWNEPT